MNNVSSLNNKKASVSENHQKIKKLLKIKVGKRNMRLLLTRRYLST